MKLARKPHLAILIGLLLAPAALAQEGAKQRGELGSKWFDGKNTRQARVVLDIEPADVPDPALYRRPAHDWENRPLQVGWYPQAAFKADKEGTVGMRIAIGADGVPAACKVSRPSGVASIDAHACAHLLEHSRYFPALDRTGQRRAAEVTAWLRYELRIYMSAPAPGGGAPPPPRAVPAAPVTLETLGITKAEVPKDVWGIGAHVQVGNDGRATACTLYVATQSDTLDKQICDRLLSTEFRPARNAAGSAVDGVAAVYVDPSR